MSGATHAKTGDSRAGALFAVAALLPALLLRGFTVDDALITARYAAHIAGGLGYRFNASGASTDGVTPLGWPYVLAPFAASGPLSAIAAARVIGVVAWVAGAAAIGVAVHRIGGRRVRYAAVTMIAASATLAAWSIAGMETGFVIGLAAAAAATRDLGSGRVGAAFAGVAAALRPEMAPWAFVLSVIPVTPSSEAPRKPSAAMAACVRAALAVLPLVAVSVTRAAIFGRAAPLSVLAKGSDPVLGARYAVACFLLTGPLALLAPFAWRRLGWGPRGLLLATLAHFAAVAVAGGDWMPLSRLVAPALPAVVLATAHLAAVADLRATAARFLLVLCGELFQFVRVGPSAAHVGDAPLRVIDELAPKLAGARVIAALDIGSLGAATDATIVDLAGLTDPAIAVLAGGHTSKHIPEGLLDARGVDTLVLLLPVDAELAQPPADWTKSLFEREVERRVARIAGDAFAPVAESHVPHLRYVVARRVGP